MTLADTSQSKPELLTELSPELARVLTHCDLPPPQFGVSDIKCETVYVRMRDGTRLATDLYLPPVRSAPVIAVRTPYGRSMERYGFAASLLSFARRGYVVVSQDCRGTGDSEPDTWDFGVFEPEDGYDLIDWIVQQGWFGGFIGSCGSSYVGQTQWPMATHPAMSTIVPHVSGLGFAVNTVHFHMFCNAYARVVGKGEGKLSGVHYSEMEHLIETETMAGGYFNEPLHKPLSEALLARFPQLRVMAPTQAERWLWERYCSLSCAGRAELIKQAIGTESISITDVVGLSELFGYHISHDAHTLPHLSQPELCGLIRAPAMLLTGWYDWCLNDALATWEMLRKEGRKEVATRSRMIIAPHAHNALGYHEGIDTHRELQTIPGMTSHAGVLLRWYEAVREDKTDSWPIVIYYLMGANEWRVADEWPVPDVRQVALYLGSGGALTTHAPREASEPDRYTYDPDHPTQPWVEALSPTSTHPAASMSARCRDVRMSWFTPLRRWHETLMWWDRCA